MKLVDKFRPAKFEYVFGQESAVDFLSGLILEGQRERNILLHGQIGSGKTTLARIYAAALNCEAYDRKEGSPCGECDRCKRTAARDPSLFLELPAPKIVSSKSLSSALENAKRNVPDGIRRIIFIDEAHALTNVDGAIDCLLEPIEDDQKGVVYILATSELDGVPAALRSRFILLAVRPLTREDSRCLMSDVLQAQGFDKPNRSALDLIAGFSEYQPRNMLHCLDQLLPKPITVERVRQVFGSPDVDLLTGYFGCLAAGDSDAALIAFLEWPDTIHNKITLIRSMLLHIYLRHLNQMDVVVDPLIGSIKTAIINEIVTKYRERVTALRHNPNIVWRDMISFWRQVPRGREEETSMLDIALFHQVICDLCPQSLGRHSEDIRAVPPKASEGRISDPWGPRSRASRRPKSELSDTHLHYDHVRELVNTASACTQAYNIRINAMVTLWHSPFGVNTREGASERMSDFNNRMRDWIERRDKRDPVCRITIQEQDPDRGYCARTIVYVPEGSWDEFRKWCAGWKQEERTRTSFGEAIEVDLPLEVPRSVTSRDARHRACVRWLLASTDPGEKAWDARAGHPHPESLRKLLGLGPELRQIALVAKRQRPQTESAALTKPTLLRQTRCHMFFLSAFDDHAWDRLSGEWERFEYQHRQVETEKRESEWREAMSISASGPIPAEASETEDARALLQSWSKDPHERQRSWDVWWPQDEL